MDLRGSKVSQSGLPHPDLGISTLKKTCGNDDWGPWGQLVNSTWYQWHYPRKMVIPRWIPVVFWGSCSIHTVHISKLKMEGWGFKGDIPWNATNQSLLAQVPAHSHRWNLSCVPPRLVMVPWRRHQSPSEFLEGRREFSDENVVIFSHGGW